MNTVTVEHNIAPCPHSPESSHSLVCRTVRKSLVLLCVDLLLGKNTFFIFPLSHKHCQQVSSTKATFNPPTVDVKYVSSSIESNEQSWTAQEWWVWVKDGGKGVGWELSAGWDWRIGVGVWMDK